MIYFLRADISLVWLPSAQRQPPVHRPFCIYAVIITKRDLDRTVHLIYKEHSLPSGIKKLQEALNRLKNMECWYKISYHLVKQNQRENQKLWKKNIDFCGSRTKKQKKDTWLYPTFWTMSYWAALVLTESCSTFSSSTLVSARENMTSPLYHPLDTLEAHSSAGSNAPCSWGLMLTHS